MNTEATAPAQKIRRLTSEAEAEFGTLTGNQLNWKADENVWSIAQCLAHIIVTNEKYIHALENAVSEKYRPALWQRLSPFTLMTGRKMIETLGPAAIKKYPAPRLFRPSKKPYDEAIVRQFSEHNEKLISLMERAHRPEFADRIISSPVAPLITLRTDHATAMLAAHEERHFLQAMRVKNHIGFPEG